MAATCAQFLPLQLIALRYLSLLIAFFPKVCVQKGIPYIVAPYEADAQLAFLVSEGYADFAITEDSDLLVYGCKEVKLLFFAKQKLSLSVWFKDEFYLLKG